MPILTPSESQVTPDARLNVQAAPSAFGAQEAQATQQAGEVLLRVNQGKAKVRAGKALTQSDLHWRQKLIDMQNDPDFADKYGEDGSGFAEAFQTEFEAFAQEAITGADPASREYVESGMLNLGGSLMAHAQDFQAQTAAGFAMDTITLSIDNAKQSATLFPSQFTSIYENAVSLIDEAEGIGQKARREFKANALAEVTAGAVAGVLESGDVNAAQSIKDNTLKFDVIEDGEIVSKSVRDIVSEDLYAAFVDQSDIVIDEAKAKIDEIVSLEVNNIETDIELAETPQDFISIQERMQKSAPAMEQEQINGLKVKYHNKSKEIREEVASIDRGNAFATGGAYLNPADNDAVKDFNNYYDTRIDPVLGELEPDERNTRLANMVATTKVIPDRLKGDIQAVSRSLNAQEIGTAADFINRVANTNPYLLQDFDQKDLSRLRMTNNLLAVGYEEAEAFKAVDEALSPANKAVMDQRREELKGKSEGFIKKNYSKDALDAMRPGFFGRLLPGDSTGTNEGNFGTRQLAQLTADYQQAYDNHYLLTGDSDEADIHANTVVNSQYGISTINKQKQLMRYAPEKYLSIPGIDNKWMREQVVEEARNQLKDTLDPDVSDEDIILVPDPKVTPRTVNTGRPAYKLMLKRRDGMLHDVLGTGKYFVFDPDRAKQEAIERARNPKSIVPTVDAMVAIEKGKVE